jgi:hypothetical protein
MVLYASNLFNNPAEVKNDAVEVGVKAISDFGNNQPLAFFDAEDQSRRSAAFGSLGHRADPQLMLWAEGLRRSAAEFSRPRRLHHSLLPTSGSLLPLREKGWG